MNLFLTREQYLADCTLGVLSAGPHKIFTLEPPWLAGPGRGGVHHYSCVPVGSYRVRPYARPSGEKVWLLSNAALDVFELPADGKLRDGARSLVMIHAAVYPHDVIDGIGVGTNRMKTSLGWMLENSRDAMNRLRTAVGSTLDLTLVIGDHHEHTRPDPAIAAIAASDSRS